MDTFDMGTVRNALKNVSEELIASKDILNYIDSRCGDGDLGISMEKVGYSILRHLDNQDLDTLPPLLMKCAYQIGVDAPSTMGTLTSLSLFEVSRRMQGMQEIKDSIIIRMPQIMVETIMIHGRAQLGDKTVLDSLIPYSEKLQESYLETSDIREAAMIAAKEAERAANATRGCIAKIGRAKWIAERSRNCPDGGAIVCAIVVNTLVGRRIPIVV